MMTVADQLIQRGKAEGRTEGRFEGKAEALLAVLTARGLAVTEGERSRIAECSDAAELDRWLQRAVSVQRVAELFG